jgi:hypothetical protein
MKNIFALLGVFFILVLITGCISQSRVENNTTSASTIGTIAPRVTVGINTTNSGNPNNLTLQFSVQPEKNTTKSLPTISPPFSSSQSGVRIFKNAESICTGDTLTFGLINEGNSTFSFFYKEPNKIQFFYPDATWGDIFYGANGYDLWLKPGEKNEIKMKFSTGNRFYEWYNTSGYIENFIIRPGLYRITYQGVNRETKEVLDLSETFTIKDCNVQNNPEPSQIISTPDSTTLDPSVKFGVRIFKSSDSICLNDDISFGLVNEGNTSIRFGMGRPCMVQVYDNETWMTVDGGGGTQAFWSLTPGQTSRDWTFSAGEFVLRPGLYRIIIRGTNEETKELFQVKTEFTVRNCRSRI